MDGQQESNSSISPSNADAQRHSGGRLSPKEDPRKEKILRPDFAPRLTVQVPSKGMHDVFHRIRQVADSQIATMILGESGTGKELVARAIHAQSARSQFPFVPLNIASLAESLLESELFGHERGAFTGATTTRIGVFEYADRGTLFLDEIGELPRHLQVKLLRVVEYKELCRVGSNAPIRVDVRIIAATNRNLDEMLQQGLFRHDLYHRLTGGLIKLPPLRSRLDDLEILAQELLENSPDARKKGVKGISPEVFECFRRYSWPGNVRELRNLLDGMVLEDLDGLLGVADIPAHLAHRFPAADIPRKGSIKTLEDERRQRIQETVERCGGNKSQAARELGIDRGTVHRYLKTPRISC